MEHFMSWKQPITKTHKWSSCLTQSPWLGIGVAIVVTQKGSRDQVMGY